MASMVTAVLGCTVTNTGSLVTVDPCVDGRVRVTFHEDPGGNVKIVQGTHSLMDDGGSMPPGFTCYPANFMNNQPPFCTGDPSVVGGQHVLDFECGDLVRIYDYSIQTESGSESIEVDCNCADGETEVAATSTAGGSTDTEPGAETEPGADSTSATSGDTTGSDEGPDFGPGLWECAIECEDSSDCSAYRECEGGLCVNACELLGCPVGQACVSLGQHTACVEPCTEDAECYEACGGIASDGTTFCTELDPNEDGCRTDADCDYTFVGNTCDVERGICGCTGDDECQSDSFCAM